MKAVSVVVWKFDELWHLDWEIEKPVDDADGVDAEDVVAWGLLFQGGFFVLEDLSCYGGREMTAAVKL